MSQKARDEIWIKGLEVLRLGEDIKSADLAEMVSANPTTVRDTLKSMESDELLERESEYSEIWKAGPKARELLQMPEQEEDGESKEPFQSAEVTDLNLDADISPPEIGDRVVPGTSYEMPYVIKRIGKSKTSWDRPRNVKFKVFEETEEMFDELSEWVNEEVYSEVEVLKSDIRQAALLVGTTNPMEVVAILNEWGYDELT